MGQEDLCALFGSPEYPGFLDAKIKYDSAGRSEGKAIVSYDNAESAIAAVGFFHLRALE